MDECVDRFAEVSTIVAMYTKAVRDAVTAEQAQKAADLLRSYLRSACEHRYLSVAKERDLRYALDATLHIRLLTLTSRTVPSHVH